ncbi:hypothetical protein D7X87_06665 [bacterium D16-54]|nr:hypothetical protein D7X87_06665 [bacterium D16-54]RKJ15742.1 hypothetical protein D7X65_06660 [bacterium D16-56]
MDGIHNNNRITAAMRRTSSNPESHTESSRLMRGAWRLECEYIFELHTEQRRNLYTRKGFQ